MYVMPYGCAWPRVLVICWPADPMNVVCEDLSIGLSDFYGAPALRSV